MLKNVKSVYGFTKSKAEVSVFVPSSCEYACVVCYFHTRTDITYLSLPGTYANKLHIAHDTTENSNNSLTSGGAGSFKNERGHLVSI